MNYNEARNYIDEVGKLGSRPGIDAIKELLKRLDNPENKINVIHVAGTNGKGSICTYLEYGLREAGLKVGRYISPTLFTYLERFQINGAYISEEEYSDIIAEIKTKCEEMVSDGFLQPTAFEIETAVSFVYSLRNKIDILVLETGMGGEEDATNVVKKPLATVFSSISFDHMKFLGNSIEEIAITKSGIMREGVPVITSHMPNAFDERKKKYVNAKDTVEREATKRGAYFYNADDLGILFNGFSVEIDDSRKIKEIEYKGVKIENPLRGDFQFYNMQTALMTFAVLKDKLKSVIYTKDRIDGHIKDLNSLSSMSTFIRGMQKAKWPGRFEIVSRKPLVIRDGAHNPDAIHSLKESILNDRNIPDKMHLIMGVYADKAYDSMLREILTIAKSFTAITPPNPSRALLATKLCQQAEKEWKIMKTLGEINEKDYGIMDFDCKDSLDEALEAVIEKCDENDGILVFGSLSLACLFKK